MTVTPRAKFWGAIVTMVLGVGLLLTDILYHHDTSLEATGAAMIAAAAIGLGLQLPRLP